MRNKRALIVVDAQNDFCPGGALAVEDGDEIIPTINQLAPQFDVVVTTKDWHPPNHGSFASQRPGAEPFTMGELGGRPQMLWPDHCVQNTEGAKLHPDLKLPPGATFFKGTNPNVDSYSGFADNDGDSTMLAYYLRGLAVTNVCVCGLTTEYCVKYTALDAIKNGFTTRVVLSAVKGINEDAAKQALDEIREAGGEIIG